MFLDSTDFNRQLHGAFKKLVAMAMKEDIGSGDITTTALGKAAQNLGRGEVILKEKKAVICGSMVADILFGKAPSSKKSVSRITYHHRDGEEVTQGKKILTIMAPIGELLRKERILLNFIQHLSGTATQTRKWVIQLRKSLGNKVSLLDTRKTLPGYRALEKYAVLCGGGHNHRMGLFDHYLIKNNHIAISGKTGGHLSALKKVLIHKSRLVSGGNKNRVIPQVEIECHNLNQVKEVVEFNRQFPPGADIIMLDNFSLKDIRSALKIIDGSCRVEVSGNIDLAKIKKLSSLKSLSSKGKGIDYISAGALTHSVPAIDFSMRIHHV